MAVDNQFKETVDALFKGMNGVVSVSYTHLMLPTKQRV